MMSRQREAFNYKDNRCCKVASLPPSLRDFICSPLINGVAEQDACKRCSTGSGVSLTEVATVTDPYRLSSEMYAKDRNEIFVPLRSTRPSVKRSYLLICAFSSCFGFFFFFCLFGSHDN